MLTVQVATQCHWASYNYCFLELNVIIVQRWCSVQLC